MFPPVSCANWSSPCSLAAPPAGCRKNLRGRLHWQSGCPAEACRRLWNDPDAWMQSGEPLKMGGRCTVVRVDSAGGPLVVKRFNHRHRWHAARHALATSRAKSAWRLGHRLRAEGVLTPEPLAWREERWGPLRGRSYLVTPWLPGEQLLDYVWAHGHNERALSAVAEAFAAVWHHLGRLRCTHGDMKAINFLVVGKQLWVIDLDGTRFHHSQRSFLAARRRDRARFLRDWASLPAARTLFEHATERL